MLLEDPPLPNSYDFKLIHELTIWDEAWQSSNQLCGAALVNGELLVVFLALEEKTQQLQEQQQPSNSMNANQAGVFNKVLMIKHPSDIFDTYDYVSPVIHAVIPEAVFKRFEDKNTPQITRQ
ncbi:hypothetical protein PoB_003597300 [Plakobranchus ocellatus]|uniref:Uncharacterized protein n=1 Tax=Plakobranchus ocellatus TaxID=259542 RepID=A0AAV4ARM5_9GAST|nr:hypothetical protein PoB_003597300 [Plakobranchus ocellatus]